MSESNPCWWEQHCDTQRREFQVAIPAGPEANVISAADESETSFPIWFSFNLVKSSKTIA